MKTPDAAFLSALIPTLLILIHVATAATDNPSQNTPLMTRANSTSTETTTKAVESSNAESSWNSTTEAPPLQGNGSSTTPSADDVTLSTSASSSPLPVQQTTPGSIAFPVTKAKTSAIPSSTSSSAGALDGGSITIVLLVVIVLLILILVAVFKWASRPSNQNSPASRLILGFGDRVRGVVRTLEDRLGFRLWPGDRGEREGDEEEGEEEGNILEVVVGVEGEGGEQKDEEEEDGEDSSDDYSSMEGDDLRQRAQSGEKEEEGKREKKSKSEEGQGEEKGGRDRERGGGEEAIALVGPEREKSEGEIEESDVTIL